MSFKAMIQAAKILSNSIPAPLIDELPSHYASRLATEYASEVSDSHKKSFGQFFTPTEIADYLARLTTTKKTGVRLLDPGMGTGVLACALIEHLTERNIFLRHIALDGFDIDFGVVPYTHAVLEYLKTWLWERDVLFESELICEDFILHHSSIWEFPLAEIKPIYDLVISNPPYFKLGKDDPKNVLARKRQNDQPNIYSLFVILATLLTKPNGELVFLIPRSFCSGPYFAKFRAFIYQHLRLDAFHLFRSRSKAFKKDAVLQENLIFKAVREDHAKDEDYPITIFSSQSGLDLRLANRLKCTLDDIVDRNSRTQMLFLPITDEELSLVIDFKNWDQLLSDFNIEVSTGPVVAFRTVQYLHKVSDAETVPLLWIDNVRRWKINWPNATDRQQYISIQAGSKLGLLPSRNYVLLRRFSAKDDKHRLIAAAYYATDWNYQKVGIENKLNYLYSRNGELSTVQTAGLTALLNSDLYDAFFRIFNGSTQVNATEARALPMPSLKLIEVMGQRVLKEGVINTDNIVSQTLNHNFQVLKMAADELHSKAVEAQKLLKALGLAEKQQNKISAYTLLALADLGPEDAWAKATQGHKKVSRGIRDFIEQAYGVTYKENTRETFRRQVLHQFVQGGVVAYNPGNPRLPVNSPLAHYALTDMALEVIRSFGDEGWQEKAAAFQVQAEEVRRKYAKEREFNRVPVTTPDGKVFNLSPGRHNDVQKAVIEEFAPRFAPGAQVLYFGDTEVKEMGLQQEALEELNIPMGHGSKLPDIILYLPDKQWIYLIEVVAAHGPISIKRKTELIQLLENCPAGPVYVTAFPDFGTFREHMNDIAWDTEVWFMDTPDHMIHFNGDRFLGPR